MAPLRTLHIIDRFDRRLGGSMQATIEVARFLAKQGESAEVAGTVSVNDDLSHLDSLGEVLKIHRFDQSFPKRYAQSKAFNRWLVDAIGDYDLVEIHAIFSGVSMAAARICRQTGKPYLVRPHGSLDPFDLKKHSLLKRFVGPLFVRPMLEGATAVLLTAQLEAARMATYGANVRKVVLSLPVALSEQRGDADGFRNKHGIPGDAQVVLFLSRVDYKKGLDYLIPALAQLKREFPALWFVLAGSGTPAFTASVHRWLEVHRVRPFTTELGFVVGQEKLDAFAAADVFALPSRNENFGIVNIEAMHAGLPLLISNEVYICREIEEAGAGMICKPSVESVITKMREMLSGAVDLKAMGKQGRELVRSRYQPEVATEALMKLYADILRQSQ